MSSAGSKYGDIQDKAKRQELLQDILSDYQATPYFPTPYVPTPYVPTPVFVDEFIETYPEAKVATISSRLARIDIDMQSKRFSASEAAPGHDVPLSRTRST